MVFKVENMENNKNYIKRKMQRVRLIPLSRQMKQYKDILSRDTLACSRDHFTGPMRTVAVSSADIAEIATQTTLATVAVPTFSRSWKTPSIEEEATLILPTIENSIAAPPNGKTLDYSSHLHKLFKNTGIYAIASFASPIVSFILSPFLVYNLSHTDYGVLAVINTAVALLAGLTQLGLGSAFFRAYNFDYETQKDRLDVLATTIVLLLLTSVPITVVVIACSPWLSIVLFNSSVYTNAIIVSITIVLAQNLTVPGFAWMRAQNRSLFFVMLSLVNLFGNMITTIILVGALHMGIVGSQIGTICGYAISLLCSLPATFLRTKLHFRKDIALGMLQFGFPNAINYVSIWILQLSDRLLLERLGSLSQTANYSVAYTIGSVLSIFVITPFQLAWPSILFTLAKRDDAANIFKLVFRWYGGILLCAAFGFSVAGTFLFDILYPASYHSATPVIPIITISTVCYGVYNFFTLGIGIKKKTWIASILTTIAAILNIAANIVLIPLYGALGAAAATLIAYMLLAVMAFFVNQRIYPIPFEYVSFISALLTGIALYIIASSLAQNLRTYKVMEVYVGIFLLYTGILVGLMKLKLRPLRIKKASSRLVA
jgi:O-antigen/teichoic acid export membrane protein